jgi:tetratricopeptide (TPR) repeat protein
MKKRGRKMKRVFGFLFSTGIIVAFLIFVPGALGQKNKENVEATDFVLDLVALYLNVDEMDEAIRILEKLTETYPEDYDIRLYMGVALYRNKDYEEAHKEFRAVEKSYEYSQSRRRHYFPFSYKNLGLLYFGRGVTLLRSNDDFKGAKNKFINALKKGYDEINVRYLLVYSYLKLKNYKKASRELDNLLEKKEIDEIDYFIKGYLNYQQGLENEAVSCLIKALEVNSDLVIAKKNLASIYYNKRGWTEAVEIWKSIIEKSPEDLESNLNIARAYYYLGRKEEAKKIFEDLNISMPVEKDSPSKIPLVLIPWERWEAFKIKYQVDYDSLIKQSNLEELKKRGIGAPRLAALFLNQKALFTLRDEGSIDEAIKILSLAQVIDQTAFFTSYNLGQLYLNSGKLEKAEGNALRVIQSKKNFIDAHDLLGNIYFKKGKYEDALKEFERVIEISEFDAVGHYNLGCAFWELGNSENAEKEWKRAVEYDSDTTEREKVKKITQDDFGYSIIVQNKPVAYRAHISLGSLYEAKGFVEKAIEEYERAEMREPNNPEAYFKLGKIYFEKNVREKAKYHLGKHIELGGKNQREAQEMLDSFKK